MQRQWGLFFGAVGLYAAAIVAMFVAGPDPYPIYGYGTEATRWAPRDVQVFREASLTVAALAGGVLMLSLPPSWTMSGRNRTRTKAYWTAHPEAFPPIRERNVREYVTVIALASAVRNLLMLALPGVGIVQGPALGV
ncbi:hypothetical protein TPB0596_30270 [Tsukamurella pulmonis]|uniref:hypothetical protein n=1 Tax=Tsukamurella pulmonis TaxID=47312 RepID=UPI001EE01FD9|nr:hypothetical protein [Tsukamurella pulmonis]BDD83264.1 hypothetical protein TPB0596_30270 [Tsukamurella pulmonis]